MRYRAVGGEEGLLMTPPPPFCFPSFPLAVLLSLDLSEFGFRLVEFMKNVLTITKSVGVLNRNICIASVRAI